MLFNNNRLTPAQQLMLMQQMQKNLQIQQNMARTIMPVQTPAQEVVTQQIRKDPKVRQDLYLELRVTNNNGTAQDVLLFDALGAYALQNNYSLPAGVTIEYTSKQGNGSAAYLYLLNYIATGSVLYFDQLNIQVDNQLQYGRPIGIYDDSLRANNVTLYDTIYLSQALNSMQQQQNRVEVPYKYKINRSTAFLYTQEANSTLIFRMFCKEMVAVGL